MVLSPTSPETTMTDQKLRADRAREEGARFRDETELAVVGGLAVTVRPLHARRSVIKTVHGG
jgi:hypothetical protein